VQLPDEVLVVVLCVDVLVVVEVMLEMLEVDVHVTDELLEVTVVQVDVVETDVAEDDVVELVDAVSVVEIEVVLSVLVVTVNVEDVAVLVGHWQSRGRPTQLASQSPSQQ